VTAQTPTTNHLRELERRFRRVAHISPFRVLLVLFFCTFATSIGVLRYLQNSTDNLTVQAIYKVARSSAALARRDANNDQDIEAIWADQRIKVRRYPAVVSTSADFSEIDPFLAQAIVKARTDQPHEVLKTTEDGLHLRYAVSDQRGGLIVIENNAMPALQRLSTTIARLFAIVSAATVLSILGIGLLLLAMEKVLHDANNLPVEQRRQLLADALADRARPGRKNRLAVISVTCAIGVTFVAVVLFSLTSSRVWHTHYAAGVATILIFAKLLLVPGTGFPWMSLANSLLSLAAIWTTALLSLANMARERNEATMRAEADTRAHESDALRAALSRAEAAEAEVRPALERLNVATQAAGISVWEYDIPSKRFVWELNRPAAYALDHVSIEDYGSEFYKLIHPEDRELVMTAGGAAAMHGKNLYSYRFRALCNGELHHMQVFARLKVDDAGKSVGLIGATWEVTDEVQTHELLQRQSKQERDLIDRLNIATQAAGIRSWELELDPVRFAWHDNFDTEWLLANGRDALSGLGKLMHPDDRNVFRDAIDEGARKGIDIIEYRYRLKTRQGTWDHLQCYAKIFSDGQSKPTRALGVSWSVTKEVEASEQLHAAERRMERASRSSFEGHWEWNLALDHMWHSDSFHALLGYPQGTLIGPAKEVDVPLWHRDDLAQHRDFLQKSVTAGLPYAIEARFRLANGDYRWFLIRGSSELDDSGKPLRVAGSVQDIHQRKLTEDALRQAQRRFERAIHGTQDGLWEIEADRSGAWFSPRCCELLGYAEGEFPTNAEFILSRLHPEDVPAAVDAAQRHFNEQLPFDIEIRLKTKQSEYRWYRARAVAERDSAGKPLRLSGSLQDTTDARAARDELLQATEAAHTANRAKSAFLANVSHEIRTPMNGILGMTSLLIDTELDRTQRDYAETIRASGDSLLRVINDILDFSKIEAGKLDIESLVVDLRANVEDVGAILAFQAVDKQLEMIVHIHPDVPAAVLGDPQRIRQCLLNLIGNSIKFTARGEIVVEVSVAGQGSGGRTVTRFEVRDTGIGISDTTLDNLFQPFTQADSSTTRHYGGTGLGLSIVRRLIELMGGTVGATSVVGQGSTFWFELPFEVVREESTESASLPPDPIDCRVLVTDDNDTSRRVLLGQLAQFGYKVEAAANAQDALSMLRAAAAEGRTFDVLLTDFQMPDIDGAMLTERMNNDPQLTATRAVMLTSMERQSDLGRSAALGLAGYLAKPVRTRELRSCLQLALSKTAIEWRTSPSETLPRGKLTAPSAAQRFSGRVLLVEDNEVNQKVATRFLARLGLEVTVVANGAEGISAYASALQDEKAFAIVMMDLQMPVMDGFTATRHIRDIEGWRKRTPIVALTANAMTGQLERCLAAGMDGFLSKPLDADRLRDVLVEFGLGVNVLSQNESAMNAQADAVAAAILTSKSNAPIDFARLREIVQGDQEFESELLAAFATTCETARVDFARALSEFDRVQLEQSAHKLKGASGNIQASELFELCAELEERAAAGSERSIGNSVEKILSAIDVIRDHLQATHRAASDAAGAA